MDRTGRSRHGPENGSAKTRPKSKADGCGAIQYSVPAFIRRSQRRENFLVEETIVRRVLELCAVMAFLAACQGTAGHQPHCLRQLIGENTNIAQYDVDNDVIQRGRSLSCNAGTTATDGTDMLQFLTSAATSSDRTTDQEITEHFELPMRVNLNDGHTLTLSTTAEVRANIHFIFTPEMTGRISGADVSDFDHVGYRGLTLFDGRLWFEIDQNDHNLKLAAVNVID
jgi:hypothetical protein